MERDDWKKKPRRITFFGTTGSFVVERSGESPINGISLLASVTQVVTNRSDDKILYAYPTGPSVAFSSSFFINIFTFTDLSTDSSGRPIVSWNWNFGDGSGSTSQNPIHAYSSTGSRVVTLTASNNLGVVGFATGTINVTDVVPVDGPDNWFVPSTSAHFVSLGLTAPDLIYLCQEPTGTVLFPVIGTEVLTEGGTVTYSNTITGWNRRAVGFDNSTTQGRGWRSTSSSFDMPLSTSFAALMYAAFSGSTDTGAATRLLTIGGSVNGIFVREPANGSTVMSVHNNSGFTSALTGGDITDVKQLVWFRNTGSITAGTYVNTDLINAFCHMEARSGSLGFGPGGVGSSESCVGRAVYLAVFKGVKANQDWSSYLTRLRGEG